MNLNETLEAALEAFEGNIRKLDELISQLELWSDECTVNHKKEELRLPQYIELHLNLEMLKEQLNEEIAALSQEKELGEKVDQARTHMMQQLANYVETEKVIHNWIREIKNIHIMMNNSRVLAENKAYIMRIIEENK